MNPFVGSMQAKPPLSQRDKTRQNEPRVAPGAETLEYPLLPASSCLVKNELGNPCFSLLLYCILLYTGSSSVNSMTVSCIRPRHCEIQF